MTERPILNGEPLPADWKIAPYWGPERILRPGDKIVFTMDRAVHEDEARSYLDSLVTRSRFGARR